MSQNCAPLDGSVVSEIQQMHQSGRRLVAVVTADAIKQEQVARELANGLGYALIRLGLILSRKLLDVAPRRRPSEVLVAVRQIVDEQKSNGVVLNAIEALFDQQLHQDPLGLLANVARNRQLVVMWPGVVIGGNLSYAQPGHPEYRFYSRADLHQLGAEVVLLAPA